MQPSTEPRRRVLLVDDEPHVVDGLRKALYPFRSKWEVHVATSAKLALDQLGTQAFDAVVTDARMPDMDGEGLLREVATRWPTMLRVVFSGEIGLTGPTRVEHIAHYFLPKPLAAAALFSRVDQSLDARDRLGTEPLKALVCRLGPLPALPDTFAAINALISNGAPLERFVEVIERDPALCANVLRVVNSAWFGLRCRISSLREAVRLLGVHPLRTLALAAELYATDDERVAALRTAAIVRLAALPRVIDTLKAEHLAEEAATALVLADVGSLVLCLRAPDDAAAIERAVHEGTPRVVAEQQRLGETHAAIGAVLLSLWNLPRTLVDAVALHHETRVTPGSPTLCTLVALTCRLHELRAAPNDSALAEQARSLATAFGAPDLDALLACFPAEA
jgi:HD-like signal output (HDOD) protein/ActR/RegA family two-component response regulator